MNKIQAKIFFWLLIVVTCFLACEEGFDPPIIPGNDPVIVVGGFIEAYEEGTAHHPEAVGIQARPAYVVLTRSIPFGESFGQSDFEDLFVHDAEVVIKGGGEPSIKLTEFCLNDPQSVINRDTLIKILGLNSTDFEQIGVDFRETNFCFYVDFNVNKFTIGQEYNLTIEVEGLTLTAKTTTPALYPIDTIGFQIPPGDSAFFKRSRQMLVKVSPPDSVETLFRYFTQRNDDALIEGNSSLAGFRSVLRGRIFGSGEQFITLPKGERKDSTFNTGGNAFGNYRQNDQYIVKWCTLDEEHFDYWNSTEFNALNQGLFSTYTQSQFNIEGEGGIGVFGGYSVAYYKGKVPKD